MRVRPPRAVAFALFAGAVCLSAVGRVQQDQTSKSTGTVKREQSRQATVEPSSVLKKLNPLVGSWRGVGQPKRGSRVGAWTETVTCQWDFSQTGAAIEMTSDTDKQFSSLRFFPAPEAQTIRIVQSMPDAESREYTGKMPADWPGKIVLVSQPDADGQVHRCTVQQLSDIRITILLETQSRAMGSFRRVAGIGYTRVGHKLAQSGGAQRKCVVTGGLGTIPVVHQGKTWYVCCQGCRQAFEAAPDEIIAEYQESLKAEIPE